MRVLAVDTSTIVASAAINDENKVIGEVIINHKKKHSEKLLPIIDYLFKDVELEIKDIDVFAAAVGPGSFTGLRIGIATIKGFAQVLNKPVIGISTLEALAYNVIPCHGIICPILDAQRNQVYSGIYKWENENLICLKPDSAMTIDELINILKGYKDNIYILGDGVEKFSPVMIESLKERVMISPMTVKMPRASSIASLALIKAKNGQYSDYRDLEPIYIRKSQAEMNLELKINNN